MKVLISGVKGQLGKSVFDLINSSNNNSIEVLGLDKIEFNLQDFDHCKKVINKFKPNWIINTSCEHMSTLWYDSVDKDQLIIMQTNNSDEFDGHINPCYTQSEMQEKYPLSKTLYVGALETPAYTRFMQIGYK